MTTTKTKTALATVPNNAAPIDVARMHFAKLADEMNGAFVERQPVVRATLAALIAREHLLMVGPPGVAKSTIVYALADALDAGDEYFEILMSRFTVPDEVFGPTDLVAFQQGRFARVVAGKLPRARFAFLDEVFKANSAILNTMLPLLSPARIYHEGGIKHAAPLEFCVMASNELPAEDDTSLQAFADRGLVRLIVRDIDEDENARRVIFGKLGKVTAKITDDDLEALRAAHALVEITKEAEDAILKIRREVKMKGIRVSPRRWAQATSYLRACAVLDGKDRVTTSMLTDLVDTIWNKPEERPDVSKIVADNGAKWVTRVATLSKALDEQATAVSKAAAITGDRKARAGALGEVIDLVEKMKADIENFAKGVPEAETDAKRLKDRAQKIHDDAVDAFRSTTR